MQHKCYNFCLNALAAPGVTYSTGNDTFNNGIVLETFYFCNSNYVTISRFIKLRVPCQEEVNVKINALRGVQNLTFRKESKID